jgi:hypothetical protein
LGYEKVAWIADPRGAIHRMVGKLSIRWLLWLLQLRRLRMRRPCGELLHGQLLAHGHEDLSASNLRSRAGHLLPDVL